MRLNERIDCKNKTVVPCRIPCIRGPSSCRHAIHNSRRKAVSGQRHHALEQTAATHGREPGVLPPRSRVPRRTLFITPPSPFHLVPAQPRQRKWAEGGRRSETPWTVWNKRQQCTAENQLPHRPTGIASIETGAASYNLTEAVSAGFLTGREGSRGGRVGGSCN